METLTMDLMGTGSVVGALVLGIAGLVWLTFRK